MLGSSYVVSKDGFSPCDFNNDEEGSGVLDRALTGEANIDKEAVATTGLGGVLWRSFLEADAQFGRGIGVNTAPELFKGDDCVPDGPLDGAPDLLPRTCSRLFVFVDRLRRNDASATSSMSKNSPLASRGSVAVVVRAHCGTTYGLRSVSCAGIELSDSLALPFAARRAGDVAGARSDGPSPSSSPESDIKCGEMTVVLLFAADVLACRTAPVPARALLDVLAVRFRSCSRSFSSMNSLRVRLRVSFPLVLVLVIADATDRCREGERADDDEAIALAF